MSQIKPHYSPDNKKHKGNYNYVYNSISTMKYLTKNVFECVNAIGICRMTTNMGGGALQARKQCCLFF